MNYAFLDKANRVQVNEEHRPNYAFLDKANRVQVNEEHRRNVV